jgi:hypothetical protein
MFAGVALIAVVPVIAACGGSSGGEKPTEAASANVKIDVTAPSDGDTVATDRVSVRGTVSPADATVQILGSAAQVGNGVFAGSVALHPGDNTIDVVASAPGATPATATITIIRKGSGTGDLTKPKKKGSGTGGTPAPRSRPAPPLSSPSNCAPGLSAGANTSCAFAENVRAAYTRSGSSVLDVYSPVTGQTYRMYCTSGSPHVCTGGNNASVYFADTGTTTTYEVGNCGNGLSVGPNTSCSFAANVRAEYQRTGSGTISVYSPVTGRTYTMYCTSGSPHTCTGANNAAVYFP